MTITLLFGFAALLVFASADEYSYCTGYKDYNILHDLKRQNQCMDVKTMIEHLHHIYDVDGRSSCRAHIIRNLANHFGPNASQNNCRCSGMVDLMHYHTHVSDGTLDHRDSCLTDHSAYRFLYEHYFESPQSHSSRCKTHESVWFHLDMIKRQSNDMLCQKDFIMHLRYSFTQHPGHCSCTALATMSSTTNMTSSTATSAAIRHTTPQALTSQVKLITTAQRTAPKIPFSCNKIKVIETVAGSMTSTHVNSSSCATGSSDDALVLSSCNVTSPSTWKKGGNVLADCESSSQLIPTYTPIATFDSDIYYSNVAQSGIFLGCSNNGLKIAIQKCNGIPEIVHIEHGAFQNNPKNYYVIVTNE